MRLLLLTGAILTGGAAVAKEPRPVLEPTGQWTVHAEDNLFALSRQFGTGKSQVVVAFQPVFDNPPMQIMIVSRDEFFDQRTGKATLRFGPGGKELSGRYFSLPTKTKGQRYTRITVSREAFELLQTSTEIDIAAHPVAATIRFSASAKAAAAFRQCENDLLVSWGIDPAAAAPGRAAKMRNPGAAFSSSHYPPDARRKGLVGRVVTVVQVDAAGKPTACRTVVGVSPLLNEATCTGAMERVQYEAGKNEAGNPAPSVTILSVNWQLG